jgi:hypothetical protein
MHAAEYAIEHDVAQIPSDYASFLANPAAFFGGDGGPAITFIVPGPPETSVEPESENRTEIGNPFWSGRISTGYSAGTIHAVHR